LGDQAIGLISGAVHLALSFVLALLSTYGSFRILDRLMHHDDFMAGLRANNIAMAALLGGVLIASAMIVKSATDPVVSTLQVFLFRSFAWLALLRLVAMILAYVLTAVVLANVTIWSAMRCFLWLTRDLDELAEIRRNNVAVGITIGITVAVMGYFISDGLSSLMQALVPFPEFRPVEVLGG